VQNVLVAPINAEHRAHPCGDHEAPSPSESEAVEHVPGAGARRARQTNESLQVCALLEQPVLDLGRVAIERLRLFQNELGVQVAFTRAGPAAGRDGWPVLVFAK
jgi:hypothetical protein